MEVLNGGREGVILRQGNHITRPGKGSFCDREIRELVRRAHQP